jgi:hypothetical protein
MLFGPKQLELKSHDDLLSFISFAFAFAFAALTYQVFCNSLWLLSLSIQPKPYCNYFCLMLFQLMFDSNQSLLLNLHI